MALDKKSLLIGTLSGILIFTWIYVCFLHKTIKIYQDQNEINKQYISFICSAMEQSAYTTKLLLESQENIDNANKWRYSK